jgi:hypothetical protein
VRGARANRRLTLTAWGWRRRGVRAKSVGFSCGYGHVESPLLSATLRHTEPQDGSLVRLIRGRDVEQPILRVFMNRPNADEGFSVGFGARVKQRMAKLTCLIPREDGFEGVLFLAPVAATEHQDDLLASESRRDFDAQVLFFTTNGSNAAHGYRGSSAAAWRTVLLSHTP